MEESAGIVQGSMGLGPVGQHTATALSLKWVSWGLFNKCRKKAMNSLQRIWQSQGKQTLCSEGRRDDVIVEWWAELQPALPASHLTWVPSPVLATLLPISSLPMQNQKMAQALGPLHPCGRLRSFLNSSWPHPGHCNHLRKEPVDRIYCLSTQKKILKDSYTTC